MGDFLPKTSGRTVGNAYSGARPPPPLNEQAFFSPGVDIIKLLSNLGTSPRKLNDIEIGIIDLKNQMHKIKFKRGFLINIVKGQIFKRRYLKYGNNFILKI